MDSVSVADAISRLQDFMHVMRAWELETFELYKQENGGSEKNRPTARCRLQEIYDEYLTPKDRVTGRLAGPDAGQIPEFDVDQEAVLSAEIVGGNKVIVSTIWTHPAIGDYSNKHRYTMRLKGNKWLIDKKEVFRSEKWSNRVF